ncbi:MAG: hypothetical protein Q8Q04_00760 [archaeon]|nr:hypothetical protein [archaeon]
MTNRFEEIISKKLGISKKRYQKFKGISIDTAVEKFLTKEEKKKIIKKELYLPKIKGKTEEKRNEELQRKLDYLVNIPENLIPYFEKTKNGKDWFYSRYTPANIVLDAIERAYPAGNLNKRMNI